MRTETDMLGSVELPNDVYWGIHTQRALSNFPEAEKVPFVLISAYAQVKKAAALANSHLGFLPDDKSAAIINACNDIIEGRYAEQFPLPYLQGGAGTSLNMNLNEVIANIALEALGYEKGNYSEIDPINMVNLHQSTNDTYPTALKIACIYGFRRLSSAIEKLQSAFNRKDKEFADIIKIGRTEMMPAVPITLGAEFAAWAEAIARDRWRTFKCEERLRVVNIGGTAVGTGLAAPTKYIFLVIEKLREVTSLGLTRAEQVMDATANADVFSEVSGMLNAFSANIIKIASDIRLLHAFGELRLPALQAGSSIMPNKVNPIINEYLISAGIKAQASDNIINNCVSRGTLQINEFLPLIAHSILDTLDMLAKAALVFADFAEKIEADREKCRIAFEQNEILITAFLPYFGYHKCKEIIDNFKLSGQDNLFDYLKENIGEDLTNKVLSPAGLNALGYRI